MVVSEPTASWGYCIFNHIQHTKMIRRGVLRQLVDTSLLSSEVWSVLVMTFREGSQTINKCGESHTTTPFQATPPTGAALKKRTTRIRPQSVPQQAKRTGKMSSSALRQGLHELFIHKVDALLQLLLCMCI